MWELNRLGHSHTARAYAVTGDQRFSNEFFVSLKVDTSNPLGRGVNWNCAMEVALRAMNLLGAFSIFRRAPDFDEQKLSLLLTVLDQHGRYIHTHLEFSHIATSNHYLSDVIGLLWLGVMLPELEQAQGWRTFALREMLREMDKQVLDDGAGFRKLLPVITVSFLNLSLLLSALRANAIEIEECYWKKLHRAAVCTRYLRPDGRAR